MSDINAEKMYDAYVEKVISGVEEARNDKAKYIKNSYPDDCMSIVTFDEGGDENAS